MFTILNSWFIAQKYTEKFIHKQDSINETLHYKPKALNTHTKKAYTK